MSQTAFSEDWRLSQRPPSTISSSRASEDGLQSVSSWPEANGSTPTSSKRGFLSIAKAPKPISKSRSSTHLLSSRGSESNSITETVSSRESFDGQTNMKPQKSGGIFQTLRKKASRGFSRNTSPTSASFDAIAPPPLPSLPSSVTLNNSNINVLQMPSSSAAPASYSKRSSRKQQKKQDLPTASTSTISPDPDFTLDTNLDEMDGIITPSAVLPSTSVGRLSFSNSATATDSPSGSDWDLLHGQSSSFGTSEGGKLGVPSQIGGRAPPNGSGPGLVFTDPFSNVSSSKKRRSPTSHKVSPKSTPAAPSTTAHGPQKALPQIPPAALPPAGDQSWNPPESWAVYDEAPAEYDDSSSDDSLKMDRNARTRDRTSAPSAYTYSQTLSTARTPQWKGKERMDDSDLIGPKTRQFTGPGTVHYALRIYRVDGHYHMVQLPLSATVKELTETLHRKIESSSRETHRLYLCERGRDRLLAPIEKPALIVKRRLEQAGYEMADGIESLGAEEIGFLLRFVFKSVRLGGSQEEEPAFEHFEVVDLTGRSLQNIPIILHQHATSIISLNLSKNPLLEIPLDFIQSCENLKEICLSNMAMKKVPHSVRNSVLLQKLDISCNRIVDLDDAGIGELERLSTLKVHNNRMDKLPWYFARMQSLRSLIISNNKFDHLPAVVCEMSGLTELDISFNSLHELPEELAQLRNLQRLIIVGNQIARFPPECSRLLRLQELDCRRNLIVDVSLICQLPSLEVLRADHNIVHSLDLSLGPSLKVLDVSHNDITRLALPAGLPGTLPYNLKSLDISHAKLSSLDDFALGQLTSLNILKLDYNTFRSIPATLGLLTELQYFSCSNNSLDALPNEIGQLQKLHTINVQHNNLKEIPASLWFCRSLVSFNASSNLISTWSEPPPNWNEPPPPYHISEVPSAKQSSRDRTEGPAAPLSFSLQKLYLADNQLEEEVFAALRHLKELRILNLSFNEISEIPHSYYVTKPEAIADTKSEKKLEGKADAKTETTPHLQELYLSGNKLSSIPSEYLHGLTKLKILFLNGNRFQTLPAELGKIPSLEVLDVGSNLLRYNISNWDFDWNWNFNKNLKYLNLSGNKRLEIKLYKAHDRSIGGHDRQHGPETVNLAEFSNLKDLRVLGLMDVTTHTTNIPDDSEDRRVRTSFAEINGMAYGIADTLGKGDHLSMFDLVIPQFRKKSTECLFGMFGRAVSFASNHRATKYLQEQFAVAFSDALAKVEKEDSQGVHHALRRSFLQLNRTLYSYLNTGMGARKSSHASLAMNRSTDNPIYKIGASGIVLYIVGKVMYVANAGDVLAVVSRQGSAELISKHHDPFDRAETARIRSAEGWVSPKGMVNDEMEVSRSFGMYNLLPTVNARPEIHQIDLTERDEFVIIGNQGLWEHVSYQTAVDIASSNRHDPMIAAQKLRDLTMSYGADDSTMIMVISVSDLFTPRTAVPVIRTKRKDEVADKNLIRLRPEVPPPTGQVALVFTDIRNSTHLWEVNPGMPTAMRLHNALLRRLLRNIGGYEVKTEGDAFMVSFPSVLTAILWCFSVQTQLLVQDWPLEILESVDGKEVYGPDGSLLARGLSVRMGVHVGYPNCEVDPITHRMDYFGPMVNRASRISSVANGGQIMCSADVIKEIQGRIPMDDTPPLGDLDVIDPALAPVVDEIRLIKYVVIPVGERKMKGLEVPEVVSLIYPKELAGRKGMEAIVEGEGSVTGSQPRFSVEQIKELGLLCIRLETLTTQRIFRPISQRKSVINLEEDEEEEARIFYADPTLLLPPIPENPTAAHLMLVLDMLALRIENAISSLAIREVDELRVAYAKFFEGL
ncbi:PP2C-domain-containing protein [Sistotremastrum suecicum HHB10207 ss-3]|uniref:PP2C-domain-containing protein n=1 Tax=Sistotremastrum suecicum HHB10207 ss-3 TaxID=1314776 RepID=A0A166I9Y4_9AGAM|nr:PP2C-domain-containing protein [Sistotremastrum suecicum HHB10207 ss-3]